MVYVLWLMNIIQKMTFSKMMKKNKKHEKIVTIVDKEPRKVYNKNSLFYGNNFYRLTTKLEKNNKEEFFFAYPNIVSKEIISTIETTSYTDKRYLFFYEKKPKRL